MIGFQLFDKLLTLPLFLGMSKPDLTYIVERAKMDFVKFPTKKIIAKADSACKKMILLLDGTVTATTVSADHTYSITETLSAPLQIQPERFFGTDMRYSTTYRAASACNAICLTKYEITRLYNNNEVFRMNLINSFAVRLQKHENRLWASHHQTLRKRIVRFITTHCSYPAGEKVIKITMNDLAKELNDSRLNISRELNRLNEENLIELKKGIIFVPALEKLIARRNE